jgi:RES domain-containing protein
MLGETDLSTVLQQVESRTAQGPYSRCVAFENLIPNSPSAGSIGTPQPLWGLGSKKFGGRFTPRNSFETVYLAEDPITASTEVGLIIKHARSQVTVRSRPWVLITVEGNLFSVLDLTDAKIVSTLGSSHQELTGEWRYSQEQTGEAPTQLLGRKCHDSKRFDGIRYPSSKNIPDGVCVAVFPGRLTHPAFLEVYDLSGNLAQRLP